MRANRRHSHPSIGFLKVLHKRNDLTNLSLRIVTSFKLTLTITTITIYYTMLYYTTYYTTYTILYTITIYYNY